MSYKTKIVIGWALSGIVLLLMIASAFDKVSGSAHASAMTRSFGITPAVYRLLGIVELGSVVLFMFPPTGVLALLLLSSCLGGAIATHAAPLKHYISGSYRSADLDSVADPFPAIVAKAIG